MRHYPIFLNLTGRRCLVAGLGPVGQRKLHTLLDSDAGEVLGLDPAGIPPELEAGKHPTLILEARPFSPGDLDGRFLAIAATSNTAVNREIAELCRAQGVLVNVIDAPELSDFIVPSHVRRGPLSFAVSTGGLSPALTKIIRQRLDACFGREYELLAILLGRLRPLLLRLGHSHEANGPIFRAVAGDAMLAALSTNDHDAAAAILELILPSPLHDSIPGLIDDLF